MRWDYFSEGGKKAKTKLSSTAAFLSHVGLYNYIYTQHSLNPSSPLSFLLRLLRLLFFSSYSFRNRLPKGARQCNPWALPPCRSLPISLPNRDYIWPGAHVTVTVIQRSLWVKYQPLLLLSPPLLFIVLLFLFSHLLAVMKQTPADGTKDDKQLCHLMVMPLVKAKEIGVL